MKTQLHVTTEEREILQKILSGSYTTLVFGSRTTGTHQPYSDLDICLKAPQTLPHALLSQLRTQCTESNLPYPIDLIDYHHLDPHFQAHIDQHATPLTACVPGNLS